MNTIETLDAHSDYEKITDTIMHAFYEITLMQINMDNISSDHANYKFYQGIMLKIVAEDLQLFYQIAVSSKKDYSSSISKKDHFTMIMLRMIIFIDESEPFPEKKVRPCSC